MPKPKPAPKPARLSRPAKLSHFDASGQAVMVDVGSKPLTRRTATASAFVALSAAVVSALPSNPKGNPLEVARIAGIQAAKRTAELIPMCHPLPITHVDVERNSLRTACASRPPRPQSDQPALKWKPSLRPPSPRSPSTT